MIINAYLEFKFSEERGINCKECMVSVDKGEYSVCTALGLRPICPEDGCRKDCPLKIKS